METKKKLKKYLWSLVQWPEAIKMVSLYKHIQLDKPSFEIELCITALKTNTEKC